MTYEPAGAPAKPVLGLVGKGITFDTGGISIKPPTAWKRLKYDMAGGATMIGAMRAIALLKPKVKVIGIVCANGEYAVREGAKAGRRANRDVRQNRSRSSTPMPRTTCPGRRSFFMRGSWAVRTGRRGNGPRSSSGARLYERRDLR